MRTIPFNTVVDTVAALVVETCCVLPDEVVVSLKSMRTMESSQLGASIIDSIIENAQIAADDRLPLCQDTGVSVYFIESGRDVYVDGAGLREAVQEGTRRGYRDGGLRMSIVEDPLRRKNTGDNTPAIIHETVVPGDSMVIRFCPKGGGCENMSRLAMLSPGEGRDGVVDFIVRSVAEAGGRPCPPLVLGVGIGGDFEYSAILSKRALFRRIGERHGDPYYADLERDLFTAVNKLGVGPMGLGGSTTVLDVFVEVAPCHIASLPVALNIQCHSDRHGVCRL